MDTPAPLISICVLTFNRRSHVERLLNQLGALDYAPVELIVVDNHSDDGTDLILRSMFPSVRHIRTEKNIGAAGRNLAMAAASGDIIVTLDDDVADLEGDELRLLVRIFADDPKIGAVNFRVTNNRGETCNWVHHCPVEVFEHRTFPTYEILECGVAFRKAALEAAGYYPDDFFLSHEGPDLAFRILEKGFKVIYTGSVSVTHSFAEGGREPWRRYYFDTRNQFWLAARNFPVSYAARYLARGLLSTLAYSLRDGYFRYWLKALADGLSGTGKALRERRALSKATMQLIREIDTRRPSVAYMVRKRLLTRNGMMLK